MIYIYQRTGQAHSLLRGKLMSKQIQLFAKAIQYRRLNCSSM